MNPRLHINPNLPGDEPFSFNPNLPGDEPFQIAVCAPAESEDQPY